MTITVGSDEYKKLVARVNQLERMCDQKLLSVQENSELKRGRVALEQAELAYALAQQGSTK